MTTMETGKRIFRMPEASNNMLTSFVLHCLLLGLLLMLLPTKALLRSASSKKELDIVFYRPSPIAVPASTALRPPTQAGSAPGSAAPALNPKTNAPAGPDGQGKSELPPGAGEGFRVDAQPESKAGKAGILAFKDNFASLAQDQIAPRLGAQAHYGAADEVGRSSSGSSLTTSTPGSSGGINVASLNRSVGGGGGGGGGIGRGGVGGSGTGRGGSGGNGSSGHISSPIAAIGGGNRPKARNGAGPARTDEEIQIIFDRHKAAFYRLYNRELRNNPALQGQMVLRLTIEPDGSVSMCALQSSNMDAPNLATQIVNRVRTINFGAKDGVQAVTISYPIDFLPAG